MLIDKLRSDVIEAAQILCDHAAYLPEGIAQVPTESAERLGKALVALSDAEEKLYKKHFVYSTQRGLNSAQVALQRVDMSEDECRVERTIDAADRLYLGLFDEVIVPDYCYRSNPQPGVLQFIKTEDLNFFQKITNLSK